MPNPVKVTGQRDWSGGVDSNKTPTITSALNPNGLGLNQTAWMANCSVRDGSISPRDGWKLKGQIVSASSLPYLLGSTFQGKFSYVPSSGTPYEIHVIGGHVIKVDPDFVTPPIDLSAIYNLTFTYTVGVLPKVYFCQAGQFLVIQSGDYNSATKTGQLPLFWNGNTLTISDGITGVTSIGQNIPNTYSIVPLAAWVADATPGVINQLYTNSPYAGNENDIVTVSVAPAPISSGPDAGVTIGVFQVGFFSGGITLTTISVTGSQTGAPNVSVLDTPLFLTNTILSPATQSVTMVENPLPALTIAPNTGVPAAGHGVTVSFTGSIYVYGGQTGDIIYWWHGGTAYGTFKVTSIYQGGMTIVAVAPLNVGSAMSGSNNTFLQINNTNPLFFPLKNYLLVPGTGQTISIPFDGSDPNGYAGSIGDTISIPSYGTYMVVGNRYTGINTGGTAVSLRAIAPMNVGSIFPFSFTLTTTIAAGTVGALINQIPAALAMAYYMGRLWYATGATANAGDIVGGSAGTAIYDYLDSVLSVTENPLVLGGDGFTMPSGSDNITGFGIPQMINASLGQGLLNIGTANAVFALQVPVTRADWIATGANNAPEIFVVATSNGFVNDWSVTGVNGDLWYQSLTPDIRSLLTAVRYFQQWGNVDISSNENYIFDQVNRALLGWASGIYFNNYLVMTTLPTQTPYGVVHPALIPLDFEPISTMEEQLPPSWNGEWEGLQIFQLTTGTFNGVQRAFATTLNPTVAGQIELWEIVPNSIGDNGARIQWQPTFPSFTWAEHGWETELKKLVSGELWLDEIEGVVEIKVQYVPDGSSCPYDWYAFTVCNATDSSQITPAQGYPLITFQSGVRRPIVFPLPPEANEGENSRPANIGYEFQPILTIKGQCRIRGIFLKAEQVSRPLYEGLSEQ